MSWRRRIAATAAAALLFAGLTNAHAHVHLCFDGGEPPATVHWALGESPAQNHSADHDFAHAHDALHAAAAESAATPADHVHASGTPAAGRAGDHNDLDLEVAGSAIAKTVKHDALCGAFVALTAVLTPPGGAVRLPAVAAFRPADVAYRRPPARAPPLPLS